MTGGTPSLEVPPEVIEMIAERVADLLNRPQ